MTIPIQPGPFDFLSNIGGALGAIGTQKEEVRQRRLAEAKDQAHNYIALRMAGLMKPKDFDTPEVQAIFHMAGFGPVSSDETPDELAHIMKGTYLRGLIDPSQAQPMSDEQRQVVGAPERGLTQGIDAKIAKSQAEVPTAQLQGAQAEAAIPRAGMTTQIEQLGQQNKPAEEMGDRYVEGLFAQTHKLPKNGAEAFAAASADPNIGPIAQQLGQSFFDQAIERLRARLADEATKRALAQARAQGASGTGLDDLARVYQGQQTRATAELAALQKPTATDEMMYNMLSSRIAALPKGPDGKIDPKALMELRGKSDLLIGPFRKVKEYKKRTNELQNEINGYRDRLGGIIGPAIGTSGQAPPGRQTAPAQPNGANRQSKWDAAAAFIKKDKTGKYKGQTPEQILGPRP